MHRKNDPTITNTIVDLSYDDDEVTINASNLSSKGNCEDDGATVTTHPSTDQQTATSNEEEVDHTLPPTISIPQGILPWGVRKVNKTAEKRKQRVEARTKRRHQQETSNPQARSRQELWMNMVRYNNLSQSPHSHMLIGTKRLLTLVEYTLSDSGASSHFLVEGSAVVNVRAAEFPIAIKLPDGSIIDSMHTCNLDIPWLPKEKTEAHIVPGLQHSSIILKKKFYEAGCKVIFDERECRVYYKGELILSGGHDKQTRMWKLPINPVSKNNTIEGLDLHIPRQQLQETTRVNTTNNTYTLPYTHQQLKYMHQSFFSPPSQTMVEAANNNQLQGTPCLHSPKQVNKYLAPLPATSKERLKKQQANLRTTRKNKNSTIPPPSQAMDDIRIAEIVDKINAPLSTDAIPNVIEDA